MLERNGPRGAHWPRWLDPRGRSTSGFGFIANRLAGLGLTLYLFLHLAVLGKLAQGPAEYDGFLLLAKSPLIMAGEFIVILAVLLHGFNGLRIILTGLGMGVNHQRVALILAITLALMTSLVFAVRMFLGAG